MFSKKCEYGIRVVVFLASKDAKLERKSLKQIAEAANAPVSFTAKILQQLSNENIITSIQGPKGGYEMDTKQIEETRLSDIVNIFDGNQIYKGCGLGLAQCNEKKPCPLHFHFKTIRDDLKSMLESTGIEQLANEVNQELAFLKR